MNVFGYGVECSPKERPWKQGDHPIEVIQERRGYGLDPGGSRERDVKPSDSGRAVLQNRASSFVDSLDVRYDRKRCQG